MKTGRRQKVMAMAAAVLLLGAAGSPLHGQSWAKARLDASPRHGEYVSIHEAGGRDLQAWVVYPEIRKKAPVVLLIHEIFGLSDWAREMADEVAAQGYIVVAPDLLSGLAGPEGAASSVPPASGGGQSMPGPTTSGAPYRQASPGGTAAFSDQSAVVKAVSALPDSQVVADLDAAADFGKRLPAASGKLFVAGFCWGGGKSFLFATKRQDLGAAFVFYGPPPPPDQMKTISTDVYGFYAGNDARITSTVAGTESAMQAAGKRYTPEVYDGAGHGFMRAGEAPDATAANAAARKAAFTRWMELLRKDTETPSPHSAGR